MSLSGKYRLSNGKQDPKSSTWGFRIQEYNTISEYSGAFVLLRTTVFSRIPRTTKGRTLGARLPIPSFNSSDISRQMALAGTGKDFPGIVYKLR
mmetsp:Transcript_39454/g.156678  ORF Transcript_39454/g.156678 Transcript_39454/m.156678 type:complete len:94 (-) Transcript_39454:280-561(-)